MTSPPRPPSPPSGPPSGTNFSRRNETMPEPPSPAFTFTTTRSMNISFPPDARPKHARRRHAFALEASAERVQHLIDHDWVDSNIDCSMEMRVKLPILRRGRTCGNDAELAPLKVESRA